VFDGFEVFDVEVDGVRIHGRRGGSGPPVLLLHGIPETHLMWHRVARALEVRAEYVRCFSDPATVHSICEEYRAAATLDIDHDNADRGRRQIRCPVLALWSLDGPLPEWYGDPLELWRPWAPHVRGHAVPGGHFLPEERPTDVTTALHAFLTQPSAGVDPRTGRSW